MKAEKRAHLWDRESLNWYVEPGWCSARLFAVEPFPRQIVDPCAGMGRIVSSARLAGITAHGYDIEDRGGPGVIPGQDFFDPHQFSGRYPCDAIVSNPPYGSGGPGGQRIEEAFLSLALQRTRVKVALFLPSSWGNSLARSRWLSGLPLYRKYEIAPRPSCPPGHKIVEGVEPTGGTKDFAWWIFLHGFSGAPTLHFLHRGEP